MIYHHPHAIHHIMMMTYWELQRWDIHRIRRALKKAIQCEEKMLADAEEVGTRHAQVSREVARWRMLDSRLELMLQQDHDRRHGPEDPEDLIG